MGADWDLSQEIAALLARAGRIGAEAAPRDRRSSVRDTTVSLPAQATFQRTA
ncbi:hypothetical protein [Amorphus sp. 3PC139-8]|uniref:hypothetical protein n=1 Tax=Amorphus sp. 3PC139-8 TaxID=2735676 RepID=UPI00345CA522